MKNGKNRIKENGQSILPEKALGFLRAGRGSSASKGEFRSNITKLYLYRFFESMLFAIPVFVLFLTENGLSMTQVMVLQSAYLAIIILLAVPAAAFSDLYGRRNALILSSLLFLIGWSAYAFGRGFTGFLLAEAVLAVSAALYDSSISGYVYENVKCLGRKADYKKIWGNVVAITSFMVGLASLFGSLAGRNSLRVPMLLTVVPVAIGLAVSLTLKKTRCRIRRRGSCSGHISATYLFVRNHKELRPFIFHFSLMGGIMFSMYFMIQPYLVGVGLPVALIGIVYLGMSIAQAIGAKASSFIERKAGLRQSLVSVLSAPVLVALLYASTDSLLGVLLPVASAFFLGLMDPVFMDFVNARIGSHNRSTVMSFKMFIWGTSAAIFSPFAGLIVDTFGLDAAFLVMAIVFAINAAAYIRLAGKAAKAEKALKQQGGARTAGRI